MVLSSWSSEGTSHYRIHSACLIKSQQLQERSVAVQAPLLSGHRASKWQDPTGLRSKSVWPQSLCVCVQHITTFWSRVPAFVYVVCRKNSLCFKRFIGYVKCFHIHCCLCVLYPRKEVGKFFPFLEWPFYHFSISSIHPSWSNSSIYVFIKRKLRHGG